MSCVGWAVAASLKSFQEVLRLRRKKDYEIGRFVSATMDRAKFTSTTYIKARACMVLAGLRQRRSSPFSKFYVEHFENAERVKSAGLIQQQWIELSFTSTTYI